MPATMRQLLLDLLPETPPTLADFVAGSNDDALTGLMDWLAPTNREAALLLWGEAGCGKSHLLRGCLDEAGSVYVDAVANPALAGINDDVPLLAVDNVQALDADGQIALFNAFNHLKARSQTQRAKLLVAATLPPTALQLREDLRTRLGSALIYRLHPLSDAEKSAALSAQAAARQLPLPAEAIDYLLRHAPRDMRTLSALISALDRYSLERKRPITLPLLREVLASALNHEQPA